MTGHTLLVILPLEEFDARHGFSLCMKLSTFGNQGVKKVRQKYDYQVNSYLIVFHICYIVLFKL